MKAIILIQLYDTKFELLYSTRADTARPRTGIKQIFQ